MRIFLTYTAIAEFLTGIGLMFCPSFVVRLLLATELYDKLTVLLAIVAGAAIVSVSLVSWMARLNATPLIEIKMLLFYNAAVSLVLLYGIVKLGFGGIALWAIIIFHVIQTAVSVEILRSA